MLAALVGTTTLQAATVTTRNFVVHAPTDDVARQVAETAEICRKELAIAWLGEELPPWYRRCPIKVKVGQIGAGGATTFTFEGGEVFGWNMNVQGTLERILDSVVPHEVSHTIFASHFRRPLPRWADEGAATLVEHESERLRQTKLLNQVLRTSRRIPLQQLLQITEYPEDMQQVLTLYAEGYSLADFLVQQAGDEGRSKYLAFLADAHEHDWSYSFRKHYGYESIGAVEKQWTDWVIAGSPELPAPGGELLAAADTTDPSALLQTAENPPMARTNATTTAAAPARPQPLAPIQRKLRTRVAGSALDAPEPNVTARPSRDIEAPPAEPSAPLDAGGEPTVALEFDESSRSEAEFVAPDADREPMGRQTRPVNGFPPARSLREVNAGYDEAFQQ